MSDRDAFRANRDVAKAKLHETRLTKLQIMDALKRADGFRVGVGHAVHGYDAGCPVCQGSPSGIAEVLAAAGLALNPDEPTLTAAEVKVLTETALRLGRKEALDFAAAGIQREIDEFGDGEPEWYFEGLRRARRLTIDSISFLPGIPSQPSQAASDATSGVPGHQEVSEAVRTPQEPAEDRCSRCKGYGYVPDFTNWDDYHGEPKPKPCPDCTKGNTP